MCCNSINHRLILLETFCNTSVNFTLCRKGWLQTAAQPKNRRKWNSPRFRLHRDLQPTFTSHSVFGRLKAIDYVFCMAYFSDHAPRNVVFHCLALSLVGLRYLFVSRETSSLFIGTGSTIHVGGSGEKSTEKSRNVLIACIGQTGLLLSVGFGKIFRKRIVFIRGIWYRGVSC